jgi:DNA-directed RNA polymerase subunit RPC12/RpoP/predicted RNA binding protein YcfA (HicA-like mRNA interferase family)
MSAAERELYATLKQHGFVLDRNNGHKVYKNSQGLSWTLPSTPSDECWAENNLHDLKNVLGIGTRGRNAAVGERREKRNHHETQRPFLSSLTESCSIAQKATFQEQLAAIMPTLFSGAQGETSGKLAFLLTPELEALKERLSEMIFEGMTVKQIAEHSGGVDAALVRIVISRLFGKGIREIRKELQPVKPITTKELDYGKLELLIRAGYSLEMIATRVGYCTASLVAVCKKYWDKTPQELRFEWSDSTYEMLLKTKGVELASSTPVPPTPQTPAPIMAAPPVQFTDKEYPCVRCGKPIRLTAGYQTAMNKKFGDKAALPKLCGTCKSLIDGKFRRVFPNQLQEGDRVIECLGCGNQILFTPKQQDKLLMKGGVEPKFCRNCRTRSGGSHKACALGEMGDIEAHFMSLEKVQ